MRGNPITGSARGVSITEAVERGQRILEGRPEPKGRERYAGRTNRPPRGRGFGAAPSDSTADESGGSEASGDEGAREESREDAPRNSDES